MHTSLNTAFFLLYDQPTLHSFHLHLLRQGAHCVRHNCKDEAATAPKEGRL